MRVKTSVNVILCVAYTLACALVAYLFTDTQSLWYLSLVKPSLQPPGLVFIIAWTLLYICLATSFSLTSVLPETTWALRLEYMLTIVLTPFWCYVFFEKQLLTAGLLVLAVMLILAIRLMDRTYRVSKVASYLLLPYCLWLAFALYLNYELVFLN